MNQFPEFMKNHQNIIPSSQQNTDDIIGYYYEATDGSQMAIWECKTENVSKKHIHEFDEYMICVSGEYLAYVDGKEILLKAGDELFIPKGTEQWGKCKTGTRTIHAFGGKRIIK